MAATFWYFNKTLNFTTSIPAYPYFICPNDSTSIDYVYMLATSSGRLEYEGVNGENWVRAYSNGAWASDNYRLIKLLGDSGPSYDKQAFQTWLSANATKLPTLNLTGTKWKLNDTLDLSQVSSGGFQIDISSAGGTATDMYFLNLSSGKYVDVYTTEGEQLDIYGDTEGWLLEDWKKWEITGGSDATNLDLIAWLCNNATLVASPNILVKVSGSWKETMTYVKVGGIWKEVSDAYIKAGGTWKEI